MKNVSKPSNQITVSKPSNQIKERNRPFFAGVMKQLSEVVILLYFLNAFYQTFPLTAYGKWLFDTLQMTPSTTNLYYSLSFLPWQLKPIYGLINEKWRYQKAYLIIFQLITATLFVVTALFINTVVGAFIVKIADATAEAFVQTLLGILIAELAAGDLHESGKLQSWINGTKNVASIVALVVGVPIYGHMKFDPSKVILWTSVVPLIGACITYWKFQQIKTYTVVRSEYSNSAKKKMLIPIALFLFLSNALPNDADTWYQYSYLLFKSDIQCIQYCSISAMLGRLVMCVLYEEYASSIAHFKRIFAIAVLFSAAASLPRILLAPPVRIPFGVDQCIFAVGESFITAAAKQFSLLPLLVLATFASPAKRRGLIYSIFIGLLDLGGFFSGILSAWLVSALGIVLEADTKVVNWDALWILILLSAAFQLVILLFLPLLGNIKKATKSVELEPLLS